MLLLLRGIIVSTLFLLLSFGLNAQVSNSTNLTLRSPQQDVIDVYGQQWVDANPTIVEALVKCSQHRIRFVEIALTADDKYPLLSSFPLLNKNNPGLQGVDFNAFTPQSFNPFVYNIEYFSNKAQMIRVDGTQWVLFIDPAQ